MSKRSSKTGRGDTTKTQQQRDWHALCSEFNLCKRKLQVKTEGLLVLAKELDNVRQEKDAYKLMAEQLRDKYHGQRKKYEEREKALGISLDENDPLSERRSRSLAQILCETREQNRKGEEERKNLRQKLVEAEGDIKILRENIARQRVGDDGVGTRHFPAHERESLVSQLEAAREQVENLERDMVAKIDELQEHVTERDFFRRKADHLNEELNYVLGGNEKRIVDIDAMIMENKYLKERFKQVQEEKSHAQATASKYKSALEKRKGRGFLKSSSGGGLVLTQKQVENLLTDTKASSLPVTSSTVADLHSLSRALLETIHDKTVAVNHLRNTNKILGNRVEELEKKLKTLEVAGLWNLPPARTAALKTWQSEMSPDIGETLVPCQVPLETGGSDFNGEPSTPRRRSEGCGESSAKDMKLLTEGNELLVNSTKDTRGDGIETDEDNGKREDGKRQREAGSLKEMDPPSPSPQPPSDIKNDISDSSPTVSDVNGSSSLPLRIESNELHAGEGVIKEENNKEPEKEISVVAKMTCSADEVETVLDRGGSTDDVETESDRDGSESPDETDPQITPPDANSGSSPSTAPSVVSNAENVNKLESLFDTVAEKFIHQKALSVERCPESDGQAKATTRTPLLLSSNCEQASTGNYQPVSEILVDTTPQCV